MLIRLRTLEQISVLGTLLALEGLRDEMSDDERQRTRPFVNETWRAAQIGLQNQRERKILSGAHRFGFGCRIQRQMSSGILTFSADETARLWDPAATCSPFSVATPTL